ncbi:hypothetical protein TNCV_2029191 [Trichonephila clavipes]|nr:hypothetical protein TNCV_2029191 [Trichonephila clavipes]
MWIDQIVLGKEEVQGSSGSIVSKMTINARNGKSQRLEKSQRKLPVGGKSKVKTIVSKNTIQELSKGKSQDLKTVGGTDVDRPNSTGKRGSARLKWIDCFERDY